MGCSCSKAKTTKGNLGVAIIDRSIPHSVTPGESCAFCAEKHFSIAYTNLVNRKLQPQIRQLAIGELECARRHLFVEYGVQAALVSEIIKLLLLRAPIEDIHPKLLEACTSINELVTSIEAGNDTSSTVEYSSFTQPPAEINPLIGELHFCAAWRLAMECGYEKLNRTTIIGDLTMAQVHLYQFNMKAAQAIRNIRHLIQRSEYRAAKKEWTMLAYNIDTYITPDISNIRKHYGEDFSWFLSL